MAKRVAVILSGCGAGSGSETREAVLALLSLDRAGAQAICAAPESARGEAGHIARGDVRPLGDLKIDELDALIFPGGQGVASVLSNYADKGQVCDVDPHVAALLKEALARHRPMGFICLAPILAARVLGPVAGVRLTLGPRGTTAAKHAAVMGADVRPCAANDIFVDQKTRVISTPGYMYEEARLTEVAQGIEKLVRTVLQLARDRQPAPQPPVAEAGPGKPAGSSALPPTPAVPQRPSGPRPPERRRVIPARGSA